MSKIRVLVVDDSAFMRKVISDILESDAEIEVIDKARNGLEGVEKAKLLNPDVVTMDIEMPVMNGLEALEKIMKEHPLPVVMLSSLTGEGAEATIRALELGAVDFIMKPSGSISLDIHKVSESILERVKTAARTRRKVTRPAVSQPPAPVQINPAPALVSKKPRRVERRTALGKLVVVGTSTGGPQALQVLLTSLPADFPAPLVIVQHMPARFTKSLAQRLDSICQIHVVEAEDHQLLEAGTAYIAPGGYHLELVQEADRRIYTKISRSEPRGGHRPSVDVLFESAATLQDVAKWAVIMTGMGSDGTKGLQKMKEMGQVTSLIEDESSCIVFGMPRAAMKAGLADLVVPLDKIAENLVSLVK